MVAESGDWPWPVPPTEPPGRGLLDGRRVVVTAAAGTGIGSAVARRALIEGARVLISDTHERRLSATLDRLEAETGSRPEAVRCDVTAESDVQALMDSAVNLLGGVDVMMNNAGLGGSARLVDMTDEQWSAVLNVTLDGTMRCTRAALRLMIDQATGGAIVNNASVVGWRAQVEQAHYAAAKAGVMALTRCAALEAAEHGIRVNCVAPSLAWHPFLAKTADEALLDDLAAKEAFGRPAEPWEVANVMVFLSSDLSGYMTGEVVSVSSQHP
ncbi:MAG: SDR family oxidoreductase [Acidimicrobiaceae bacterium]|nr:SDR family oxidoreductase [Acidimicrobiaceae bacterium]MYB86950.1 SDR family oxidoreductase [Acidimicrobiaceae bacterium]MYH94715.1 SDR family oxidoreductase [Acidimicrobiaceae bacterium]